MKNIKPSFICVFLLSFINIVVLSGCEEGASSIESENLELKKEIDLLNNVLDNKTKELNRMLELLKEIDNEEQEVNSTPTQKSFHLKEEKLLIVEDRLSPETINIEKITGLLGEPESVEEYEEAHGSGKVIEFHYEEATFIFNKNESKETLKSLVIRTSRFATNRGITIGSTRKEIARSYGTNYEIYFENDSIIQIGEKNGIAFMLNNDVVEEIKIWFEYE